jgi:hypothetical protein
MATPRVVVVHRASEYDALLGRHGTRGQAAFFLQGRGRDLAEVERRHAALAAGLHRVSAAIPLEWRRSSVERADLAGYLFTPDDLVVVVGQDGLVANVAKYLHGQPVLGINPDPDAIAGVLTRHEPAAAADLLHDIARARANVEERAMVRLAADDRQELVALNEVYVGHASHQTARYRLGWDDIEERQASSGLIVGTGTGATGWCLSAWSERERLIGLPGPLSRELAWFVREAWPSPMSGTTLTQGLLLDDELRLDVESDRLVAFGDGIEADRLELTWGQRVTVARAERVLRLV